MKISRHEATLLASFLKMMALSEEEKMKVFEDAKCDKGIEDESEIVDEIYLLRVFLQQRFGTYTNSYIEKFVLERGGWYITINSPDVALFSCPCCNYNTLDEIGDYDICRVCYWEDDGTSDINKHSGPNRMSLKEARLNFKQYGVIEMRFLHVVDPERMMQYAVK